MREIAKRFYGDTPSGITGNDDCGQMSAWYVLASLGLYPVDPASGSFVLGEPLINQARVALPNGRTLRISAGAGLGAASINERPAIGSIDRVSGSAGGRQFAASREWSRAMTGQIAPRKSMEMLTGLAWFL